ncbi:hypothetical protein EVG20_g3890 [Dentipellis fragilis]|uniref:DUF6533 domain-containing protein n=1 Tax=Dentipellis fragilis TaxID=205917 RepID=A0A4Y9YYZ6_9AGAM|nr:hypothetical protein EVG20_g3890 [Dentipellis fragilis]
MSSQFTHSSYALVLRFERKRSTGTDTIAHFHLTKADHRQLYDYFLNLPDEIDLIWESRWNAIKVAYLLNRYVAFGNIAVGIYHQFGTDMSESTCQRVYTVTGWLITCGIATSEVMLVYRTYMADIVSKYRHPFSRTCSSGTCGIPINTVSHVWQCYSTVTPVALTSPSLCSMRTSAVVSVSLSPPAHPRHRQRALSVALISLPSPSCPAAPQPSRVTSGRPSAPVRTQYSALTACLCCHQRVLVTANAPPSPSAHPQSCPHLPNVALVPSALLGRHQRASVVTGATVSPSARYGIAGAPHSSHWQCAILLASISALKLARAPFFRIYKARLARLELGLRAISSTLTSTDWKMLWSTLASLFSLGGIPSPPCWLLQCRFTFSYRGNSFSQIRHWTISNMYEAR